MMNRGKLIIVAALLILNLLLFVFIEPIQNIAYLRSGKPRKEQRLPPVQAPSYGCSMFPLNTELLNATGDAQIHVPSAGSVTLKPYERFCIRVVVPVENPDHRVWYSPLYPGTPWDSLWVRLVETRQKITIPLDMKLLELPGAYLKDRVHIYEGDVELVDPGEYEILPLLEYRRAEWNFEWNDIVPYAPREVAAPKNFRLSLRDDDSFNPYHHGRHFNLPYCEGGDHPGRWLDASLFTPEELAQLPTPENHNKVWVPYKCRYRRYTYQEFEQCISKKYPTIHWYGDSNTRRALKKITTQGEWCSRAEDQTGRACICEDNVETFSRFDQWARVQHINVSSSLIYHYKWDGLTGRNNPPWRDVLEDSYLAPIPRANIVIISLVNWDAAFSPFLEFAKSLNDLIQRLQAQYTSKGVPVIVRTGQHFCCRVDTTTTSRRFSRLRVELYEKYATAELVRHLNARVWDVYQLGAGKDPVMQLDSLDCPSNHARSEVVEIENQILFNMLCNES
ncbi:hypothetical protein K493DRAFT_370801 [Basidiobolus meristosporus CBS 931.73]|uniref:Uncharacterized protein n=1 Tax=Basidiobolus meristosporus CBS 931.73 TaxID=1314790 RepID=A0A1Y1YF86_9FUNG|nr:hypothetical protein K493DRAFT_370801 [Basidiobolus meristosporus CBS 931.73]|eukprot:ORX96618.1 hypothetical protein K493DRAFT_370801 [Basidiobolus meristosporus CBS 931.73]